MKITIICDVPLKENNGTAIAALNLIHFLKKQGHLLKIICPESDIPLLEDEIRVPKINFFFFNGYVEKNGVTLGKPEKKILRAAIEDADVVHLLVPFALSRAGDQDRKAARDSPHGELSLPGGKPVKPY